MISSMNSMSNVRRDQGGDLMHLTSHQNYWATTKVQRLWRGYKTRLSLWKYGGVLMVSRVLKIQRVFRGFQGRLIARIAHYQLMLRSAHKIRGMYYRWKCNTQRLIVHIRFLNKVVTKLQSHVRRQKGTKRVKLLRFIRRTKMSIRIQSVIRMFLGRCRYDRALCRFQWISNRLSTYTRKEVVADKYTCLTRVMKQAATVTDKHGTNDSISEYLDIIVCNLAGTGRSDVALALATNLASLQFSHSSRLLISQQDSWSETASAVDPGDRSASAAAARKMINSGAARCLTFLSLMTQWPRAGVTRSVRTELFEEATGIAWQYRLSHGMAVRGMVRGHDGSTTNRKAGGRFARASSTATLGSFQSEISASFTNNNNDNDNDNNNNSNNKPNNWMDRKQLAVGNNNRSPLPLQLPAPVLYSAHHLRLVSSLRLDWCPNVPSVSRQQSQFLVLSKSKDRLRNGGGVSHIDSKDNLAAQLDALRLHGEGELIGGMLQLYFQCARSSAAAGFGIISRTDTLLLLADFVTFYSLHCEAVWPAASGGAVDAATATVVAGKQTDEELQDQIIQSSTSVLLSPSSPSLEALQVSATASSVALVKQGSSLMGGSGMVHRQQSSLQSALQQVQQQSSQQQSVVPLSAEAQIEADRAAEAARAATLQKRRQRPALDIARRRARRLYKRACDSLTVDTSPEALEARLKSAMFECLICAQPQFLGRRDRITLLRHLLPATAVAEDNKKDKDGDDRAQDQPGKLKKKQTAAEIAAVVRKGQQKGNNNNNNNKGKGKGITTKILLQEKNAIETLCTGITMDVTVSRMGEVAQHGRGHHGSGSLVCIAATCTLADLLRRIFIPKFLTIANLPPNTDLPKDYVPPAVGVVQALALRPIPASSSTNTPQRSSVSNIVQNGSCDSDNSRVDRKARNSFLMTLSAAERDSIAFEEAFAAARNIPILLRPLLLSEGEVEHLAEKYGLYEDMDIDAGDDLVSLEDGDTSSVAAGGVGSTQQQQQQQHDRTSTDQKDKSKKTESEKNSMNKLKKKKNNNNSNNKSKKIVVDGVEVEVDDENNDGGSSDLDSSTAESSEVGDSVKIISDKKVSDFLLNYVQAVLCSQRYIEPVVQRAIAAFYSTIAPLQSTNNKELGLCSAVRSLEEILSTGLRLCLPAVEHFRSLAIGESLVLHSTRLLQKVYRGFRGRVRYRRLLMRQLELARQRRELLRVQARLDAVRHGRDLTVATIQKIVRGWSWRKELRLLNRSALIVQCRFRMFRAKRIVEEERKRRLEGVQVIDMTARGGISVKLENCFFVLKIYRSGNNYRLIGTDAINAKTYEGHIHQSELQQLLRYQHGQVEAVGGPMVAQTQAKVQPYQHERVCDLIVKHLGFTSLIKPVTSALGGSKIDTQLRLVVNIDPSTQPAYSRHTRGVSKFKAYSTSAVTGHEPVALLPKRVFVASNKDVYHYVKHSVGSKEGNNSIGTSRFEITGANIISDGYGRGGGELFASTSSSELNPYGSPSVSSTMRSSSGGGGALRR